MGQQRCEAGKGGGKATKKRARKVTTVPADRKALVAAVQGAAEKYGRDVTFDEFHAETGFSKRGIEKFFPHGWMSLKKAAGLSTKVRSRQRVSDEEILADYHRVVLLLGKRPTAAQHHAQGKHPYAAVSRYRTRDRLHGAYLKWLGARETQEFSASGAAAVLAAAEAPGSADTGGSSDSGGLHPRLALTRWDPPAVVGEPSRQYGEPIEFRGLRHAPINELGVVLLFGMLYEELGFTVEAVHAAFPDCEAKRCTDRSRGRWKRVRIEFEFESRNFLAHGHDPDRCDLIVCWNHNWPDCPLEVLELRHELHELTRGRYQARPVAAP